MPESEENQNEFIDSNCQPNVDKNIEFYQNALDIANFLIERLSGIEGKPKEPKYSKELKRLKTMRKNFIVCIEREKTNRLVIEKIKNILQN